MSRAQTESTAGASSVAREAPAFRVDGATYRWAEVFAHARRTGDWHILETDVRQALACRRLVRADGPPLSLETQREAETAFRRARRLHAAEDLEAWLIDRGLTVAQWRRYIRGEALRRRHAPELDTVVARYPPGDEEVAAALPVWGVCSGAFPRWAEELATRAAAAHAVCHDEPRPVPEPGDLATHETLFDRFAAAVATPERLEARIASRYLEWLRLDCEVAAFPDADTAAEARLCVRDDGWSLAEAARAGRAARQRRSLLVEEVDADARHHFVRARDGDLLGPLLLAGEPVLVEVHHKHPPSLDDDELRSRASHELVVTAAAREVDDRVTWLHPR